ncbi:MAG: CoA pyrophosphatase [Thermoplasmata archaeon]
MTGIDTETPDATALLQTRLATLPEVPLATDRADAAVLILLRSGPEGLEVLAEQRAERAGDPWSGHVGLPGGRANPADHSMQETALRELREEVGILPEALDGPPGLFDVRRARPSGLRVAVFAGRLIVPPQGTTRIDPKEVAGTFWFPLSALHRVETRPRSTLFGEINVETVPFASHVVWGFTLRVLRDFEAWLRGGEAGAPDSPGELQRWRSQAF